jgi:RecA-family ATPase
VAGQFRKDTHEEPAEVPLKNITQSQTLQADPERVREFIEYVTQDWGDLDGNPAIEVRSIGSSRNVTVSRFALDWIDEAVDHIFAMNAHKQNIYMCINPVDGDTSISSGRGAKDENILAAFFNFADADTDGAMQNILSFAGPKFTMSVKTGTTPFVRGHAYWKLEEPVLNLDAWKAVQKSIAASLGTDATVVNPSRIMRVAGTVSWPNDDKRAKGYVEELVTMRTTFSSDRDPVPFERMMRAFPAAAKVSSSGAEMFIDTGQQALDRALAEQNIASGQDWHNNIIRLVASYVSKGLSDSEIHALTDRFTMDGYTVEDTRYEVQQAIDGAREKGWTPEREPEPVQATPEAIQDFPIDTTESFLSDLRPLEYLIDGLLPTGVAYSLTGYAGHGKTTLALQIALSVALGEPFGERETSKGSVLILAGENPHNVKWQYAAALAARRIKHTDNVDIHFVQNRFSIAQFKDVLKAKMEAMPDLKLIIIDSLQAFFEGDNDNDNSQMVEMAHKVRSLCDIKQRPAIVIIAHPAGKTPSKDNLVPRGGGAFLNEIDGNLTVWSQDAAQQTLHHSQKFRGAGFDPMEFIMQVHEFDHLTDIHGTPLKLPVSRPEMATEKMNRDRDNERILEMYLETVEAGAPMSVRELAAQRSVSRWRAEQIIRTAKEEKLIRRHAKTWVLTDGGRDYLASKEAGI